MKLALIVLLLLAAPAVASADSMPDYSGLTYEQRLGNQIPMQAVLRDDDGAGIRLSDLADGRPLILVLGYFHCPNLCGIVRADLFVALHATAMAAGRDYSLAALSIDPEETSADAAAAKAEDLHRYGVVGAERNWHFIIGAAADIRDIADAVGFHDRFDPQLKQFVHPVGTVFLTPGGIVSGYLLGVGYQPARCAARRHPCRPGRCSSRRPAGPSALLSLRRHDRPLHAFNPEIAAARCSAHRRSPSASRCFWRSAANGSAHDFASAGQRQRTGDRPLILALVVSLLVLALVFGSDAGLSRQISRRQRHRSRRVAKKTWRLEIAWTAATLLAFFGLFIWAPTLCAPVSAASRCAEDRRGRQAMDVEGRIPRRPARDQCRAYSGRTARSAGDDIART